MNRLLFGYLLFFIISPLAFGGEFIQLRLEPSNTTEADSLTLLLNRSIIAYTEIRATETTESAWYKVDLFIYPGKEGETETHRIHKMLTLDCNNKKVVNSLSNAILQGNDKLVDASKACRIVK